MTARPGDTDTRFYVYELIDPRDGLPFYVGKGMRDRWREHLREHKRGCATNVVKDAWIGEIVAAGMEPAVRFVQIGMTEAAAFRLEAIEIRRQDAILTNRVNPLLNEEMREQHDRARAKRLFGRIVPYETWARRRPRPQRDHEMYLFVFTGLEALAYDRN